MYVTDPPASDPTDLSHLPPPPGTDRTRFVELSDDEWLAAMAEDEPGRSRYADSAGREVIVEHPGLVPPAAITFHEGVPAAPVEFLLKGDAE